jgi:hypothetical protein
MQLQYRSIEETTLVSIARYVFKDIDTIEYAGLVLKLIV